MVSNPRFSNLHRALVMDREREREGEFGRCEREDFA